MRPVLAAFVVLGAAFAGCVTSTSNTSTGHDPGATTTTVMGTGWQPVTSLPFPLAEAGSAQDETGVYLVGGFAPLTTLGPDEGLSPEFGGSTAALHYDPATEAWSRLPGYPLPIHHAQLAARDGDLFAFGGYVGGVLLPGNYVAGLGAKGWPLTNLAYRLDQGAMLWTPVASLPDGRAAGAAVALGDRILILAGVDAANAYPATTWWYDPASDTYTDGPALPEGRDHVSIARDDGSLYVIGGRHESAGTWTDLERVDALDVARLTWRPLPDVPMGGGGQGAVVHDGILWVGGGEIAEGPYGVRDEVHLLDLADAQATWRQGPTLSSQKHGFVAADVAGRITVIGGALGTGPLTKVAESYVLPLQPSA